MVRLRTIWGFPGNWLAHSTTAEQRRNIATWLLIFYIATWPLRYLYRDKIWMVWVLSEIAIVFSVLTLVTTETPVEEEVVEDADRNAG